MTRTAEKPTTLTVPICRNRVNECIRSARFWNDALAAEAAKLQGKADTWALIAGLLGIVSGLTIWVTLVAQTTWYAQAAATAMAILAGLSALVPRIKNYGERAGQLRGLAPQYGEMIGRLLDLADVIDDTRFQEKAVSIVDDFQKIKTSKDAVPGLTITRPVTRA